MPVCGHSTAVNPNEQGLHLYHFSISNCSQRARFALEEKGANWISHHVDLIKFENLAPAFQELNPKGVVPVLVHNGKVVTESTNIIEYVEDSLPGPSLRPADKKGQDRVTALLGATNDVQMCIKTLTFEILFRKAAPRTQDDLEYYRQRQQNTQLVAFMESFVNGFPRERLDECFGQLSSLCGRLETMISDAPFLSGDQFSLADIALVVNVHRCKVLNIDLSAYPRLLAWYERVAARPSFAQAITAFEPARA